MTHRSQYSNNCAGITFKCPHKGHVTYKSYRKAQHPCPPFIVSIAPNSSSVDSVYSWDSLWLGLGSVLGTQGFLTRWLWLSAARWRLQRPGMLSLVHSSLGIIWSRWDFTPNKNKKVTLLAASPNRSAHIKVDARQKKKKKQFTNQQSFIFFIISNIT